MQVHFGTATASAFSTYSLASTLDEFSACCGCLQAKSPEWLLHTTGVIFDPSLFTYIRNFRWLQEGLSPDVTRLISCMFNMLYKAALCWWNVHHQSNYFGEQLFSGCIDICLCACPVIQDDSESFKLVKVVWFKLLWGLGEGAKYWSDFLIR